MLAAVSAGAFLRRLDADKRLAEAMASLILSCGRGRRRRRLKNAVRWDEEQGGDSSRNQVGRVRSWPLLCKIWPGIGGGKEEARYNVARSCSFKRLMLSCFQTVTSEAQNVCAVVRKRSFEREQEGNQTKIES